MSLLPNIFQMYRISFPIFFLINIYFMRGLWTVAATLSVKCVAWILETSWVFRTLRNIYNEEKKNFLQKYLKPCSRFTKKLPQRYLAEVLKAPLETTLNIYLFQTEYCRKAVFNKDSKDFWKDCFTKMSMKPNLKLCISCREWLAVL